ncbi:MAG: class I SAM-dependent methyltransferase [Ferruginibacter sp.]
MNIVEKAKRLIGIHKPAINIAQALAGENVHCVCCDKSFITFLPFGVVKRANALCPNCASLERHRLHWHYMKNRTTLFSNNTKRLKLLHVAPEAIFYNKFMNSSQVDYVPCDKFEDGYESSYPAGTINIDITDINFKDNEFDVVYCSHVLEHVIEDKKAMQEILRVLKPGGWALLQVPLDTSLDKTFEDFSIIDPQEKEKAFGQKDHVRIYGNDYKDRLTAAGFSVKVDNYLQNFPDSEIFKNGFMKGEDIYICSKK